MGVEKPGFADRCPEVAAVVPNTELQNDNDDEVSGVWGGNMARGSR